MINGVSIYISLCMCMYVSVCVCVHKVYSTYLSMLNYLNCKSELRNIFSKAFALSSLF